jgi:hypothetical protein
MKISIQPRNGDSFDQVVKKAVSILQQAEIASAKVGTSIDDRRLVLVDSEDLPGALAALEQAGLRATINEHSNLQRLSPRIERRFQNARH